MTRYFGEGFEREGNSVNRKYIMAGSVRLAMRETAVPGGSAALPAALPAMEAPIVVASSGGGVLLLQVRDATLGGWISGGSLLLLAVVLGPRGGSRRLRRTLERLRAAGVIVVLVAGSVPLPWELVPLGAEPAFAGGGGGGGGGTPSGTIRHFHADRLGSTMVVTQSGGSVVQHLRCHDRNGFSCGVDCLDRYLRTQASQDVRRKANGVVIFVEMDKPDVALGYDTLCATTLTQGDVPPAAYKHVPRYPLVSATVVGGLAVTEARQGDRLGSMLLADAVQLAIASAGTVGSSMLVAEAINDRAAAFYEGNGFVRLPASLRLVLPLHAIQRLVEP